MSTGPESTPPAPAPQDLAARVERALELQRTGQPSQGAEILRGVLAEREAVLGANHPELAPLENNLASCLLQMGRLEEAEPLIRRTVELAEAADPPHPALGTRLHNLAKLLHQTGRLEEAEGLFRRVIEIEVARYGENHPEVAFSLSALGRVIADLGRSAEATAIFERCLAMYEGLPAMAAERRYLGEQLSELARSAAEAGRRQEAIGLARRALAVNDGADGTRHWAAGDLNLLGILLQEEGQLEEAEAAKRRALAINEEILDPDDPELGVTYNNLGFQLLETGRAEEAVPFLRRALAIAEAAARPDPELIADRIGLLASALRYLGRFREAALAQPSPEPLAAPGGPLSPLAVALRRFLEQLDPTAPYPVALLVSAEPDLLAAAGGAAGNLDTALAELQEAGMIGAAEYRSLRFQPAAAAPEPSPAGSAAADAALRLALAVLSAISPPQARSPRRWPIWKSLYSHATRLLERSRRLPASADAVALETSIAILELAAVDPARGEARLRRVVEAAQALPPGGRTSALGTDALSAARTELAQLLERQGRKAEAIGLFREVMADREALSGRDHPDLVPVLNDLANALIDSGRPEEAEPLLRRAVALAEKGERAQLGTLLANLTDCLLHCGRPAAAEPWARRALELAAARDDEDPSEIAAALVLLGKVLARQERLDEAFGTFERAAASYGHDPDNLPARLGIANEVTRLSFAKARAGRPEEAIVLGTWALAIHEQDPDPQFWAITDLNHLGTLLNEGGLVDEAEKARRRALAIAETVLHPSDRNLGTTLNNLGCQLVEMDRAAEAEPLLRRALAIAEAAQPPDPERVAARIEMLAEALRRLDRHAEAATLLPAPPKFPFH